jgi:hypothetical protein
MPDVTPDLAAAVGGALGREVAAEPAELADVLATERPSVRQAAASWVRAGDRAATRLPPTSTTSSVLFTR